MKLPGNLKDGLHVRLLISLVVGGAIILPFLFLGGAQAHEVGIECRPSEVSQGQELVCDAELIIPGSQLPEVGFLQVEIGGPTPVGATFRLEGNVIQKDDAIRSVELIDVGPVGNGYGYNGYGYEAPFPTGYGYGGYGYGGYGYGPGVLRFLYRIVIDTGPMDGGDYTAKLLLYAGDDILVSEPDHFTIVPVEPGLKQLAFVDQPGNAEPDAPFGTQPTVEIQDAQGNRAMGDNATQVTLAISGDTGTAGAVLSGTLTRTAVDGLVTFTDLSIDLAGLDYVLTAAAPDLAAAFSQPFGVGSPLAKFGDADGNGRIDRNDMLLILQGLNRPGGSADLDGDGVVTLLDLAYAAMNLGRGVPVPIDPPADMVSWWPGDNHSMDIMDGNDGMLMNGATYGLGMVGPAFSLDGVDDFVLVPGDRPNLNITGDVTVDLWAQRTVFGRISVLIDKGANFVGGTDRPDAYTMWFSEDDHLVAGFARADGSLVFLVGPVVTDSQFHHYAYVRSGNTHNLMVDGVVATSDTFTGVPGDASGLPLTIGAVRRDPNPPGFAFEFGGVIDEVEIFNRALSAEEIRAIYMAGSAGKIKLMPARIAFASDRDGNFEIYVMNADGSDQTRLTNRPGNFDCCLDWSPDGERIAFQSEGSNWEIFVMDADGSNVMNLSNDGRFDGWPSWSPDINKIAFFSNRDGDHEIYSMSPDGLDVTQLTDNSNIDRFPAWSPDGAKIAFSSDMGHAGNEEVYVMNADGTGAVRLTNNSGGDWSPEWSPDGLTIAFRSERDGNDEIYVINADGSGQARLTNDAADDDYPDWAPAGGKIAFASEREGPFDVYIMNADGSDPTRITTNPAADRDPAWSPGSVPMTITQLSDEAPESAGAAPTPSSPAGPIDENGEPIA